jgi:hypothetical protein
MKTKSGLALIVLISAALMITSASAQNSGNVTFSTGAVGATVGGAFVAGGPGMTTMTFVAGELSGNMVKGAPYSAQAETQTTQVLADGNRIVNTTTASVYRDASGRERREQAMPNLGSFGSQSISVQTVMISDPVAGVNYSLNPTDRVAMELPMPQGMAGTSGKPAMMQKFAISGSAPMPMVGPMMAPMIAPAQMVLSRTASRLVTDPPQVEQLGTQLIQGVQAQGTRTTIIIPAGQIGNDQPLQIVDETWRSPELQVIVQSTHSDPRMGTTAYTLKNISRNDPSPSLFQVPADYTIQDAPAMTLPKLMPSVSSPPAQ